MLPAGTLEVLHCALMLLGRFTSFERPEIPALAGFRIFLS
jgi:hypothetical protein